MRGSSRLRVWGVVAIVVPAAALGWAPAAHAAGVGVSIQVTPAVPTAAAVTRTVEHAVPAVAVPKSPVKAAAATVAKTLAKTVRTAGTAVHVAPVQPKAQTEAPTRTAPTRRIRKMPAAASRTAREAAAKRPSREQPARPLSVAAYRSGSARRTTSAPAARSLPAAPAPHSPSSVPSGGSAAAGSGFAPLFFALGAALLALVARSRGRPLLPSVANGRGCALTLDLERPD